MTNEEPRDPEIGRAPLEFLLWRHSEQFRAIEGSDRKTERALELGLASAGVFTAAVAFIIEDGDRRTVTIAMSAGILMGILFAAVLACFFRSYAISSWRAGPVSTDVARVASGYPSDQVRTWLIEELAASIVFNSARSREQAAWSTRALVLAVAEAASAVVGLAAVAVSAAIR